jgi:hypothetical protein
MGYTTNRVGESLYQVLWGDENLRSLEFRPNRRAGTIFVGNGYVEERRGRVERAPMIVSFVIGLPPSVEPDDVRQAVMETFPTGGTIVLQLGWFQSRPEDSVRVTIENTGTGLSDGEFRRLAGEMVGSFTDRFGQKEIWMDVFQGADAVDQITFKWVP